MNTSNRLISFLDAVLKGDTLHSVRDELRTMVNGYAVAESSTVGQKDENQQHEMMLRVTADVLYAIARQDHLSALECARGLQAYTLAFDPFEGRSFRLAARLASQLQGQDADYFEKRYQTYQSRSRCVLALEALGEALASPYLATVKEVDSPEASGTRGVVSSIDPWILTTPAPSTFLPLSNTSRESSTRTYTVLVRKLIDPTTAAFAVFPATLADLTDGGPYGRENRRGELYADLLLEFGSEALSLLALDLDGLSTRFVFKGSHDYETFSVQDETLFDLEVAADECRLYFKLKIPPAWLAAELPLHLVWANIEGCVLLSETG